MTSILAKGEFERDVDERPCALCGRREWLAEIRRPGFFSFLWAPRINVRDAIAGPQWQQTMRDLLGLDTVRICSLCRSLIGTAIHDFSVAEEHLQLAWALHRNADTKRAMRSNKISPSQQVAPSEDEALDLLVEHRYVDSCEPQETLRSIDRKAFLDAEAKGVLPHQALTESELRGAITGLAALARSGDIAIALNDGECVGLWLGRSRAGAKRITLAPVTPTSLCAYLVLLGEKNAVQPSAGATDTIATGDYSLYKVEFNRRVGWLFGWCEDAQSARLHLIERVGSG